MLNAEKSDEYFASRPLSSQQAAIASPQSEIIKDRDDLEQRFAKVALDEKALVRPDHWGGYAIEPTVIEFWQEDQVECTIVLPIQRMMVG